MRAAHVSALEPRLLAGLISCAGGSESRRRRFGARLDLARSMGFRAALRKARERAPSMLPGYVRDSVYREIWTAAAARAGADCEEIGPDVLRLERDGASTFVRQQVTALDDPVTLTWALDKPAVHRPFGASAYRCPSTSSSVARPRAGRTLPRDRRCVRGQGSRRDRGRRGHHRRGRHARPAAARVPSRRSLRGATAHRAPGPGPCIGCSSSTAT